MRISACDVTWYLILVKATASLEARGSNDAKMTRRCHSKKLEWLASGRVGKPMGGPLRSEMVPAPAIKAVLRERERWCGRSRSDQNMIRILCDSARGGSKREKK